MGSRVGGWGWQVAVSRCNCGYRGREKFTGVDFTRQFLAGRIIHVLRCGGGRAESFPSEEAAITIIARTQSPVGICRGEVVLVEAKVWSRSVLTDFWPARCCLRDKSLVTVRIGALILRNAGGFWKKKGPSFIESGLGSS